MSNATRAPLGDAEIERLQQLLDRVPAALEALDVSMLDGFLCGVLLQPKPVAASAWLPYVTDMEGRALPPGFDATGLHAMVLRRHAELDAAVAQRLWFDPWVFEMADEAQADPAGSDLAAQDSHRGLTESVYPWVAGFVTALEVFPGLLRLDAGALSEPLALLYRHLDANDLEEADELLELIESLEPPANLEAAVEELVRATLLLADVTRPQAAGAKPAPRAPPRPRGVRS
jgi:uncharacterized protein